MVCGRPTGIPISAIAVCQRPLASDLHAGGFSGRPAWCAATLSVENA